MKIKFHALLAIPSIMALQACAYVNVVPTANDKSVKGLRVYAPKALLVVSGTTVSSVIVPDCSKEFAVQFGSVLAKNDITVDIANGMVTKIDNKQDTTALPLKILDVVKDAAVAGKSLGDAFSAKADGDIADQFGVYSLECKDGNSTLVAANPKLELSTVIVKGLIDTMPPVVDDGQNPVKPLPKGK